MPLRETAPIGAPCWIDLFTTDPDKSRAFYGELFGWKAEEPNPEFGGYFNFTKDDQPIAGGMRNDGSSGAPDAWTVYLAVDGRGGHGRPRPPRTAARSSSPRWRSPTSARWRSLTDPGRRAHRHLAARPAQGLRHRETNRARRAGSSCTPAAYDASVAFYRDVFGWDTHTHSDTPEFRYTTLGDGDDAARRHHGRGRVPARRPSRRTGRSTSTSTTPTRRCAQVTDLGGAVVEPAQDTPYGRLAAATDSTGAQFKLMAGN